MVLFKSNYAEVKAPEDLTVWEWLFESKEHSPLRKNSTGSHKVFVDAETREQLNWKEVESKSTALSTCWIRNHGLKPGDTVSVFSGNSIWYPVCMLATLRAGARINGASTALTVDEIAYALKVAKTKIVITTQPSLEKVRQAALQVGIRSDNVFLLKGQHHETKAIQDLIELGISLPSHRPHRLPAGKTNKEVCGFLNFSSGTTGLPKPVMLSHHNIIMQCHIQRETIPNADKTTLLAILPLYHVIGTWRFCLWPIFLNTDCVMLPSFTMPGMLKAIVDFHIEDLMLVPPIILRLARDPLVEGYDLRHLKKWKSGAAPISPEVLKSLKQRFPWVIYCSGYGATEAPVVTGFPESYYGYEYAASVGMLLPNTEAKIIDSSGNELGVGETGEILVRGPQVAMGYLGNKAATLESFDSDGFYHTGDAGHIDGEGLLYISDRIKELIKVKGQQVAPAELEDLLLGHEIVADCAVIGQPDEYAGELPKAYVVLRDGILPSNAEGQRLLDYVKGNKAKFKWLVEVEFVSKIPKSAAGKLLRKVLRETDRTSRIGMGTVSSELRIRDTMRLKAREHNYLTNHRPWQWTSSFWNLWQYANSFVCWLWNVVLYRSGSRVC